MIQFDQYFWNGLVQPPTRYVGAQITPLIVASFTPPGTPMTSIFEGQPPKTRPKLQPKQGSFGFQAVTHLFSVLFFRGPMSLHYLHWKTYNDRLGAPPGRSMSHTYGCWTKNRGGKFTPPKWMGENKGQIPIKHGMIWRVFPLFFGNTHIYKHQTNIPQ